MGRRKSGGAEHEIEFGEEDRRARWVWRERAEAGRWGREWGSESGVRVSASAAASRPAPPLLDSGTSGRSSHGKKREKCHLYEARIQAGWEGGSDST